MGSLNPRNAAAAEAAAENRRKDRREKRGMGNLRSEVYQPEVHQEEGVAYLAIHFQAITAAKTTIPIV
jgi:hypothetical protein